MNFTEKDYQEAKEQLESEACNHAVFGSCVTPCPWCGVLGFYSLYDIAGRHYHLCKWCGMSQDTNQTPIQCRYELCRRCIPDWDGTRTKEQIRAISKEGVEVLLNKPYMRLTMKVGHKCKRCNTTMELFQYKVHPMQFLKDEVYHIHFPDMYPNDPNKEN